MGPDCFVNTTVRKAPIPGTTNGNFTKCPSRRAFATLGTRRVKLITFAEVGISLGVPLITKKRLLRLSPLRMRRTKKRLPVPQPELLPLKMRLLQRRLPLLKTKTAIKVALKLVLLWLVLWPFWV